MTGRRGRRRRKLLDELKERTVCSHFKAEDLYRTVWTARFGTGFGPVGRQTEKWMDLLFSLALQPGTAMAYCGSAARHGYGLLWLCSPARLWPTVALQPGTAMAYCSSAARHGYGLLWLCSPARLWPPRSRGFMITHNDAPQSVGLLRTSDQLVAETSNWQHTQQTNIHASGVIRTHDRSRRAALDLRLRPRGHWDRQMNGL
jgi:hypothetical protein